MENTDRILCKLKMIYDDAIHINDNMYFCKKNNYWGKFNAESMQLSNKQFNDIRVVQREKVVITYGDTSNAIYSYDGKIIFLTQSSKFNILNVVNGLIYEEMAYTRLKGIVNVSDTVVIPFMYNKIKFFKESGMMVLVEKDNELLSNYKGEPAANWAFDKVTPLKDGRAIACIGETSYIIEPDNKSVHVIDYSINDINKSLVCEEIED